MYNKADTHTDSIVIRMAGDGDAPELRRLAQLDSARLPGEPMLAAFAGGRARAAISVGDGAAIADPFLRTAEILAMLEARLFQVRGPNRGGGVRDRIFGGIRSSRRARIVAQPPGSVRPLA